MYIEIITDDKWHFRELLLLADESEEMIAKYLERGTLFALFDGGLRSVCVVTDEGDGLCELKNLATYEEFQHLGYGSALVAHTCEFFAADFDAMLVGTGGTTVAFYEQCGFEVVNVLKNYFIEHYDFPIIENCVQVFDRVNLKKRL